MENELPGKSEQAEMWGRAAGTYSRVGPRFFQHFGKRLVEIAGIGPGERVLDVAAGRGAILFPAAEAVGPEGSVVGGDYSQGMVDETGAEITMLGLTNAEMLQMDAEQLEFSDEEFDCVFCGFALFFFPDVHKALSEFSRVLKPGGTLAVSTWTSEDERWKWLNEVMVRPRPQESKDAPRFDRPDGMAALLREAGFADVNILEEAAEFFYRDEEDWWTTQWSHGARLFLEKWSRSPEKLEQIRGLINAKLSEMRQPEGIPIEFRAIYSIAKKPNDC